MDITSKQIIDIIKIHPLKVKNIYMFGSRVYGTYSNYSDYDFIVIASSLLEKQEFKQDNLNIHVHIPNIFLDGLNAYNMQYLECIYAPDYAILKNQLVMPSKNFKIKNKLLIDKGLSQSYNSFHNAKIKIYDGDLYRSVKSIFHSIRILDFFIQIKTYNKIIDFSTSNYVWDMLKIDLNNNIYEWEYFKQKYLPIKINYENILKNNI